MQKLTNMEAQRVINCLEDSLGRLHILANVPSANPDPDLLQAVEEDGNPMLRQALEELWAAEEDYLMARAQSVSQSSHGRRHHHGDQQQAQPQVNPEITSAVHTVVRTVCRQVRRDPVAMERITGRSSNELRPQSIEGAGSEFLAFYRALEDLTRVTFQKLATTVEEEASSKALMHELVERERGAEDERNALSATLAVQREERAKEAAAVGELEARLRSELASVIENTAAEKKAISSESAVARSEAASQHESTMESLEARLLKLDDMLKDAGEKHREVEQGLRKKKEKGERDLAAKVAEFDEAMFAKQGALTALKQLMAVEKAELDAMEEHFAKVDANNAQRAEEERVLSEFRQRVLGATATLNRAATRVQKVHRGNADRARLKAEAKGKGKKKKGK